MQETKNVRLTATEIFILMLALDNFPTTRASGATDESGKPIGDKWLIELSDKLQKVS